MPNGSLFLAHSGTLNSTTKESRLAPIIGFEGTTKTFNSILNTDVTDIKDLEFSEVWLYLKNTNSYLPKPTFYVAITKTKVTTSGSGANWSWPPNSLVSNAITAVKSNGSSINLDSSGRIPQNTSFKLNLTSLFQQMQEAGENFTVTPNSSWYLYFASNCGSNTYDSNYGVFSSATSDLYLTIDGTETGKIYCPVFVTNENTYKWCKAKAYYANPSTGKWEQIKGLYRTVVKDDTTSWQ